MLLSGLIGTRNEHCRQAKLTKVFQYDLLKTYKPKFAIIAIY